MNQTGPSPATRRQPPQQPDHTGTLLDVARMCAQWLEQEEQFQQTLDRLLKKLSQTTPFGSRSQAVSASQLLELTSQRAELQRRQSLCRSALGRLLNCDGDAVHLSSFEGLLPPTELHLFRERRLRLVGLLQANQQLLRTVEVKLTYCNVSVTNLLNDLLGQPEALAGYGADGLQTISFAGRTLHTIS